MFDREYETINIRRGVKQKVAAAAGANRKRRLVNSTCNSTCNLTYHSLQMRLLCIIPGPSCKLFSVTIDENHVVDRLKDAIRTVVSPMLADIDAVSLTLYKIDVNALDEDQYAEGVNRLAQKLSTLHELNPTLSMGEVFPLGPLDQRIEILVEVPASESLNL